MKEHLLKRLERKPDARLIRSHVQGQSATKAIELSALLTGRVGEPISLTASEMRLAV